MAAQQQEEQEGEERSVRRHPAEPSEEVDLEVEEGVEEEGLVGRQLEEQDLVLLRVDSAEAEVVVEEGLVAPRAGLVAVEVLVGREGRRRPLADARRCG